MEETSTVTLKGIFGFAPVTHMNEWPKKITEIMQYNSD